MGRPFWRRVLIVPLGPVSFGRRGGDVFCPAGLEQAAHAKELANQLAARCVALHYTPLGRLAAWEQFDQLGSPPEENPTLQGSGVVSLYSANP